MITSHTPSYNPDSRRGSWEDRAFQYTCRRESGPANPPGKAVAVETAFRWPLYTGTVPGFEILYLGENFVQENLARDPANGEN